MPILFAFRDFSLSALPRFWIDYATIDMARTLSSCSVQFPEPGCFPARQTELFAGFVFPATFRPLIRSMPHKCRVVKWQVAFFHKRATMGLDNRPKVCYAEIGM